MNRSILFIALLIFTGNASTQTYKVEEITISCTPFSIEGLNSAYDDFSPVVINNQLVFTSGRETSLVLSGENNWKKTGHVNLFAVNLKNGWSDTSAYRSIEPFSTEIRTANHTGPACFSVTGDTIFYTQVAPKTKHLRSDRKPQLYSAVSSESGWTNLAALPFTNAGYTFAHPAWDCAHNTLYFVSDLEGGAGGKDIYRVKLENGTWGALENVAEINTPYDEIFPVVVLGDIYFSSNRPGGKGAFDLYWKVLGNDQEVKAIDELNTAFDEIGMYVSPDRKKGFYSSNPEGHDDLFFFYLERQVTLLNEMAGQFTYRNLSGVATGLTVQLYSEEGDLLFEQKTDDQGYFEFRSLPGESYTIKAVSEENLELVLFDVNGDPATNLLRDHEGAFQYKKIDYADAGTLAFMDESMLDMTLKTGWITGQFAYEDQPGKYVDSLKVFLVDENGNIAFSQYTDARGNFDFKNLSHETNYLLTTEDIDQNLVLFIFDKEGNVVAQLKQNETGSFTYRKIKADYVNNLHALAESDDVFEFNTMTLTGNFNYKKLEGDFKEGLEVMLYNEEGEYILSTRTDENGEFRFTSLDPTVSYLFAINEENLPFELSEFNLLVTDRYGEVVAELYRGDKGFFTYRQLEAVVQNNPGKINETESEFILTQNLSPAVNAVVIFFDKNSSYPAQESYADLGSFIDYLRKNPSGSVTILAYADSRSTDEYNLYLSEKRGNRIRDYLISRGVKPSQIHVTAYGESRLQNHCTDAIECGEEEHSQNRRVEVVIQK
ncbi:MAG: OmpA family protein [Bacteroidetes bacterium]|nr:OmpA family protein [Bacteroidota bacterium]